MPPFLTRVAVIYGFRGLLNLPRCASPRLSPTHHPGCFPLFCLLREIPASYGMYFETMQSEGCFIDASSDALPILAPTCPSGQRTMRAEVSKISLLEPAPPFFVADSLLSAVFSFWVRAPRAGLSRLLSVSPSCNACRLPSHVCCALCIGFPSLVCVVCSLPVVGVVVRRGADACCCIVVLAFDLALLCGDRCCGVEVGVTAVTLHCCRSGEERVCAPRTQPTWRVVGL